jgi:CheY-like chemotaxis protein
LAGGGREDFPRGEADKVTTAVPWSVLVVEDDEAVRSTVAEGLRDAGLLVEAIDGAERINGWRGDVIVTDTFANPYSTEAAVAYLTRLRSRYTSGLVVLSGHNGAAADAAQLPADAVVMKPFDLDDLIRVVTEIARTKHSKGRRALQRVD